MGIGLVLSLGRDRRPAGPTATGTPGGLLVIALLWTLAVAQILLPGSTFYSVSWARPAAPVLFPGQQGWALATGPCCCGGSGAPVGLRAGGRLWVLTEHF